MHFDELLPTDAQLKLSQEAYAQAIGMGVDDRSGIRQKTAKDQSMCAIF